MKNNFKYDFTNHLKQNAWWWNDSSKDIILRFYLFTHQFCNESYFEDCFIPNIFKDFLEDGENVYINIFNHKLYFKIKNYKDKELQKRIEFILNTLSISIEDMNDENNLEITYRRYDNTDYRGNNETIY